MSNMLGHDTDDTNEILFQIQRIYIKDASFEAPKSPQIFQKNWEPEVKLNLDTNFSKLADEIYEVVLHINVTVTIGMELAFLCEIQQAGIFIVNGIKPEQIGHCLGAYCPNILFPYARECITSLISKGSFPQFNLAPVNFDALFIDSLQKSKAKGGESCV